MESHREDGRRLLTVVCIRINSSGSSPLLQVWRIGSHCLEPVHNGAKSSKRGQNAEK